jgi:serine phosphatase RsbU (regulator of sigma subunit)
MKLGFQTSTPNPKLRQPIPTQIPELPTTQLAARYRSARVGGDFYDFATVGGKLLFILMDIAGKRENALHVAAAAQETFRTQGTQMFSAAEVEDGDAITHLILEINRRIMAAAEGMRSSPAILGCFDESINTLSYINAGHTPAVLRDDQGTLLLEPNGLPLGLFTHATHDSQFCAIEPGATLMLVSRGVVEVKAGGVEFGIERVKDLVAHNRFESAAQSCDAVLTAAEQFKGKASHFGPRLAIPGFGETEANDMTALALLRNPD